MSRVIRDAPELDRARREDECAETRRYLAEATGRVRARQLRPAYNRACMQ